MIINKLLKIMTNTVTISGKPYQLTDKELELYNNLKKQ
jgi:hypothetical protein